MMYTYKRFKRYPLKRVAKEERGPESSTANNKKNDVNKLPYLTKATLFTGIFVMLILSVFFASRAGEYNKADNILAYDAIGQPNASGSDDVYGNIDATKFILSQEMPIIYGVDMEKTESVKPQDGHVNTEIDFNIATEEIKLEITKYAQEPKSFFVGAQGPQILIYHTHAEEAYRQIIGQEYVEAGKFYTKAETDSIQAVGDALKSALENYGYSVLHDGTDHMVEGLSKAYSKSLATMLKYADEYPTLKVYIDVHRDSGKNQKDFVTVNGDECARVMFVVGLNKTPEEEPKFESNYKLALALSNELEKLKEGFTRPIRVQNSSKHYNQQVSDMCLLIEVGHNANSLQQAMNSAKYVAQAISRVIEISGP